jgi:hypothetical protein
MISIEYYALFLKGDAAKISKMKNLIKEDLKKTEIAFFKADSQQDFRSMRSELHKISPIIFNLRYKEFYSLIEQYKVYDQYNDELKNLNEQLRQYLAQVYIFLEDI